jgi:hypothetical protein
VLVQLRLQPHHTRNILLLIVAFLLLQMHMDKVRFRRDRLRALAAEEDAIWQSIGVGSWSEIDDDFDAPEVRRLEQIDDERTRLEQGVNGF